MRLPLVPVLSAVTLSFGLGSAPLTAQPSSGAASGAHHADLSLGVRFGTPGIGLELAKLLTSHVAVRVGAYYFKVNATKDQSDVTYNASLKLQGASALLDLYPGRRGGFHFTAGITTNPLTVTGTGQPTGGTYEINGTSYTSSQVGTLTAVAKFPGTNPYVGIGFGTPARNSAVEFLFDLGAVIGQPTITLSATGAANDPTLLADVQAQVTQTQTDVRKYLKVYPVLAFGLAIRF
jgi:hypothetical protein